MKQLLGILFKKNNYGKLKSHKIKLVNEFQVSIPKYEFDQIVKDKCKEEWFRKDSSTPGWNFFTDENFSTVSHRIIPNKIYNVKIFRIGKWISGDYSQKTIVTADCLNFLKEQKAYLVGMKGLMLLDDYIDKKVLKKKPLLSLDEKINMEIGGFPRIPLLGYDYEKYFGFGEDTSFDPGIHILCVTDVQNT